MLIAIGIYNISGQGITAKFTKVASAQKESRIALFSTNHLELVEKKTLAGLSADDLLLSSTQHFTQEGEHHYVKCAPGEPYVLAICSRNKLDPREAHYLLTNMWHAFKRSETARVTLQNIIDNPLGYTGKDCLIDATLQSTNELKAIMIDNVDKIIERGEKLDELHTKTIELQQASLSFEANARKLRGCCW